jgi:hypothetical protein
MLPKLAAEAMLNKLQLKRVSALESVVKITSL